MCRLSQITVNSMTAFFLPPDDLQLDELTNATLMKLEQFRDRTSTGQCSRVNLNITIFDYFFLMLMETPQPGKTLKCCYNVFLRSHVEVFQAGLLKLNWKHAFISTEIELKQKQPIIRI